MATPSKLEILGAAGKVQREIAQEAANSEIVSAEVHARVHTRVLQKSTNRFSSSKSTTRLFFTLIDFCIVTEEVRIKVLYSTVGLGPRGEEIAT